MAIATFTPLPTARDAVREALRRVTESTHSEPGCLLLALHESDDGNFLQVGKWASLDLWRAHGDAESVATLNAELDGLLAIDRRIAWFHPTPVGLSEKNAL